MEREFIRRRQINRTSSFELSDSISEDCHSDDSDFDINENEQNGDTSYSQSLINKLVKRCKIGRICKSKKSKQERFLDSYITESILKNITETYIKGTKAVITLLFVFAILLLFIYNFSGLADTASGQIFIVQTYFFMAYLIVCFLIVHFRPKMTPVLIPLSMACCLCVSINMCVGSETYQVSEYLISCNCLVFILVVIAPTQYFTNCLCYGISMLYYFLRVYFKYEIMPITLVIALVLAFVYFSLAHRILYLKVRSLYKLIIENKRLISEMKKILQTFPHGVIIQSRSKETFDKIYFSNKEFEMQIQNIHDDLEELKKINVTFDLDLNEEGGSTLTKTNLSELLKHQEEKLKGFAACTQNNIRIECRNDHSLRPNSEEDDSIEQIEIKHFNIKTLKVCWEGNKDSYMHVFIDTTDIIKLEEANNNIRCQRIMFASASHEFRTPLNAISNSIEFIESTRKDLIKEIAEVEYNHNINREGLNLATLKMKLNQMQRFVSMGSNSCILLLSLIDDILDLSKLEAGTFKIQKNDFYVIEVLQQVYDIFDYQCLSKKLKLELYIEPELKKIMISSDKSRLKQILLNIISNSYKFTFKGFISINVNLIEQGDKEFIEFCIQDSGIGIKREDQKSLFKLFSMVSDDRNINPNGSGIGLTVSKRYVEKLGGEIHLKSQYGVGTNVRFTIEIQRVMVDHNPFEDDDEIDRILKTVDSFDFDNKESFLEHLEYADHWNYMSMTDKL